jgi:ATP-dependent DNA ligase
LAKISSASILNKEGVADLEITEFIDTLKKLASVKGKGSREQKEQLLENLFRKMQTENEIFFVVRFLQVSYFNLLFDSKEKFEGRNEPKVCCSSS